MSVSDIGGKGDYEILALEDKSPLGKDLTWENSPREVILMDASEHARLMDKIAKMERRILNG